MNFRYVILLATTLIFTFSCVREEENIKPIPFDTIPGTYKGLSRTCISQHTTLDTLCSGEFSNDVKIFIFSPNQISISDLTKKYENFNLAYLKTEKSGDNNIYFFQTMDSTSVTAIMFNEQMRTITLENKITTDSDITTDLFIGRR